MKQWIKKYSERLFSVQSMLLICYITFVVAIGGFCSVRYSQKQFALLSSLINRDDVDNIANAGDADREGEIIVRTCVRNARHSKKKQPRLWLPDQTPQTVAAALQDMKDEQEYDTLADEGFARTYIDWLYGVNLTRYATIKSGTLLRVGRVIAPIVRAIYDRDMAIRNFV